MTGPPMCCQEPSKGMGELLPLLPGDCSATVAVIALWRAPCQRGLLSLRSTLDARDPAE
jgi:hypothetical protein